VVAPRPRAGDGGVVRHRRAVGPGPRSRTPPHHARADRTAPEAALRRRVERRMKSGTVALVGRPNAGKSTLLNRIVDQKLAIVYDKPQTTRNRIVGVKRNEAGEMIFIDTPGIHRTLHRLIVRMVTSAGDSLRDADVVGVDVDASEPTGAGDRF